MDLHIRAARTSRPYALQQVSRQIFGRQQALVELRRSDIADHRPVREEVTTISSSYSAGTRAFQ